MIKGSVVVAILFVGACAHAKFVQTEEGLPSISSTEIDSFATKIQGADVSYYSDFFSFVGKDENGFVAFAIEINRGKAGDDYQADQFVVLHDESAGFVEIPGTGRYPNPEKKLVAIPSSSFFDIEGSAATGIRITSRKLALSLTVEPMTLVTGQGDGSTIW